MTDAAAPVRARHRFEFAALRVVAVVLARSPYRLALLVGYALALFGHYVLRYRVRQARERIRQVFPEYTPRQVRRVAWRSWVNFIFNSVDMFRLPGVDAAWIARHVDGAEAARDEILRLVAGGSGAVVASPHIGPAELAAVVFQRLGVPIFLITGRQSNPLVDERLTEMRAATGIPLVRKGSSLLKSVIRRLRSGEVLAFLADLRVEDGIVVDFLGHRASVAPGMALFAHQTQVPILPTVIARRGWTRHRLTVYPAVLPDPSAPKEEDRRRMTQEVFDVMERAIREMPEQWFWFNKSWILDPPGSRDADPRPAEDDPATRRAVG